MIDLSTETEALARRLAEVEHLSLEESVSQAIEKRARAAGVTLPVRRRRDTSAEAVARRKEYFEAAVRKIATMPVNDPRSPQEILNDLSEI